MAFFREHIAYAEAKKGLAPNALSSTPGSGSENPWNAGINLVLLKNLPQFGVLGRPLLIGPSRKAFIGKILGLPPQEREEGTMASVAVAIVHGANMVRVHEV